MATAFAKLFKKKHNKENDEPHLHRGRHGSASLRFKLSENISGSSKASGVYTGELEDKHSKDSRQSQHDGIFHEVSLSSSDQWKYRSPYWKVTEPKTKKSSRSVPGVPTYSSSVRSRRDQRRYSPPSKSEFMFQHPTILEVSGSYENYPSNSSQNESPPSTLMKSTKDNDFNDTKRHRKYGSLRERNSSFLHDSKEISRRNREVGNQPLNKYDNAKHHAVKHYERYYNKHNSTSEYGSADPSPTNHFSSTAHTNRTPADFFLSMESNSLDNTDYETDSDDAMPSNLVHLCEQQLRLVNNKCRNYKEKAKRYKANYSAIRSQLEETKVQLANERSLNKSLNNELLNTRKEIERFREFINLQFRNNPYNLQTQVKSQQFLPPQSVFPDRKMNLMPLNNDNKELEKTVVDNSILFGAGEAMCSRTELTSVNLNDENERNNFLIPSAQKRSVFEVSNKRINEHDELDELKTFRQPDLDYEDEKECSSFILEQPRAASHSKNSTLNCYLSPVGKNGNETNVQEIISDDCLLIKSVDVSFSEKELPYVSLKEDDGYSTMQQQDQLSSKLPSNLEINAINDAANVYDIPVINMKELNGSCNDNNNNNIRNSIEEKNRPPTPPVRKSLLIRRSFSETDINNMCMENDLNINENILSSEVIYDVDVEQCKLDKSDFFFEDIYGDGVQECPNKRITFHADENKEQNSSKMKKCKRYCARSPKNRNDYSSSYSSDDEAVRVLSKQLRHRGDLVHFRPPRKSLVNCERKLFRHFGSRERQAIAQFDYLHDMPSDVSGLLSSPDPQCY